MDDSTKRRLACLEAACALTRTRFDRGKAERLAEACGSSVPDMVRTMRRLGLKAGRVRSGKPARPPYLFLAPDGWGIALAGSGGRTLLADTGTGQAVPGDVPDGAERVRFSARGMLGPGAAFSASWVIREFLKHRASVAEILTGSLLVQILALVFPLFMQVVIDKVLPGRAESTLLACAVAFSVLTVFDGGLSGTRDYLVRHTSARVDAVLGSKVYLHLLSLPMRWFETRRVGDVAARVREVENLRRFLAETVVTCSLDAVFAVVFLAVMVLYSPMLSLVSFSFTMAVAAVVAVATPVYRRRLEKQFEDGAEMQSYLVESVTGSGTVKAMCLEERMASGYDDKLGRYLKTAFSVGKVAVWSSSISRIVDKLGSIAVIFLGVSAVFDGDLTVGQLVAFNMFSRQFSGPVMRLVSAWNGFQQARVSLDRVGDILHSPPEPGRGGVPVKSGTALDIRFEDAGFCYGLGTPPALDQVSVSIPAGAMVGVVGPSGSGKSTLLKLAQGLYQPGSGRVLVGGMDASSCDPSSLRSAVACVPQESFLFTGTVRDNVASAKPGASDQEVIAACVAAGAHDFVTRLPGGYDGSVGERGSGLSGGQRQRLAIARAILADPGVLILDEATSALDPDSERTVYRSLNRIRQGRTVLLASHRLSVMPRCDRVLFMKDGRVGGYAPHQELLSTCPGYAALWASQTEE